jgi:hypothetical protein
MQTIANKTQTKNNTFLMPIMYSQPSAIQTVQPAPPVITEPVKKVKWGEPTWYLFHTLSVKIKDTEFANMRVDLLNNIYTICINLPCPDCANHAKLYLDNINFNAIQTKEDFKKLMHAFHNDVNKRKGYPYFPYEQIDEKYSLAITNNIIVTFMHHFSDRNRSIKLLATDLHRSRLCISLKEWFNQNINNFHP